jgi:hypothetical protein
MDADRVLCRPPAHRWRTSLRPSAAGAAKNRLRDRTSCS